MRVLFRWPCGHADYMAHDMVACMPDTSTYLLQYNTVISASDQAACFRPLQLVFKLLLLVYSTPTRKRKSAAGFRIFTPRWHRRPEE